MKVLIIGGGIGGMTAALSLHRAGIDAHVFESVREIKELGVGINLLPHAVRELTELGLQDALAASAIETSELIYHTKYGRPIWSEARGIAAGYKWPQYSIHRGALQMLLLRAVTERLGSDHVHAGHHLAGFDQDADGIVAHFAAREGGTPMVSVRGDALIAADGIHSTVRGALYPDEGPPEFSGITMWRGVRESAPFLDGRTMVMVGNWSIKAVIYPISRDAATRGRALINWVAEVRGAHDTIHDREDWNRRGHIDDFLSHFADWRFNWLDIPALFGGTDEIYEFPMADRDPLPAWSFGQLTLLGDAAHPMYPIGSNGASQAILDARALASALASEPSVDAALKRYEADRLEATARVVLSNREFGPERVMQLVEDRCPADCENIHDYVAPDEMEAVSSRYKKIAGFDQETLNARASYDDRPQSERRPD
jgi:2-polyprenyl-6-methoxyphenol hydroxylase-like FAD-dependent oxidoreductase